MATYDYMENIDGRWVEMSIDLDELRDLALKAEAALTASGNPKAISETVHEMRGSRVRNRGGWKVVMSSNFGWVAVRNYSKTGSLISAAKYDRILNEAGIETKGSHTKHIELVVKATPKVAA